MQKTGPSSVSKVAVAGSVDACADEVGGDEVRRELDARERAAEHAAVVLIVSVFARPGTPSIRRWPLREQADEHALEHRVLPGDHAPDLEERVLQAFPRLGCCGGRTVLGGRAHGFLLDRTDTGER